MEDIVRKVFGPIAEDVERTSRVIRGESGSKAHGGETDASLSKAEEYVRAAVEALDAFDTIDTPKVDDRPGRIGPESVRFDVSTHRGSLVVSPDRLSVNSQSNFGTIRANTALYSGKWMYEVQLGSKGTMQIGWGTASCEFNQESGVGDTAMSYAYDGNRVRKWNVATHKYGESWLSGDIIGCALDMDEKTISFYRNGRNLGVAFRDITTGRGVAYIPTVSLASTENLTANFGTTPLKYPAEGYQTLQASPNDLLSGGTTLLDRLEKLASIINEGRHARPSNGNKNIEDRSMMSVEALSWCIGGLLVGRLGPLFCVPYVTEALFVPFLRRKELVVPGRNGRSNGLVVVCMDLLWMFMEQDEIESCLDDTIVSLLSSFRQLVLSYPDQCYKLSPLVLLCRHSTTRQHLLRHVLFDRVRFANFLHIKPLDERGLRETVRNIWWETDPIDLNVEKSRTSYMNSCENIKTAVSELESLQIELLTLLLDNTDGNERKASSRSIFLQKYRKFLHENLVFSRTPLPITICCFHRLVAAFKILWNYDSPQSLAIPCRYFYDGSIDYSGIDRLGGVLSHLEKTYRSDLLNNLGVEHEIVRRLEAGYDTSMDGGDDRPGISEIPALARLISIDSTGRTRVTSTAVPMILERLGLSDNHENYRANLQIRPGPVDEELSLIELLDGTILFYHTSAKKQIAKVAALRDGMFEFAKALSRVEARLESLQRSSRESSTTAEAKSTIRELIRTVAVLKDKLAEQSRQMAWVKAAVYSKEKQSEIAWLLRVVTSTLTGASSEGNVFSFVPDFYLEALSDLCLGLRNHLHPTAPIDDIRHRDEIMLQVGEFLANHFFDPRIVDANAKDTLVLTIAGFVSDSLTLGALERVPEKSRQHFVINLLRPYENRAWAQSNWILARFWQGHGFAFRYDKSPHLERKFGPKMLHQDSITRPIKPCPSRIYQNHVERALLDNMPATIKFINSLLNQLNWAFSEFIGMIQEIHNVSSRPERVFIESRQLKICATCFDLAVSLLRVIEMIATIAPSIFNDPSQYSSENLLVRLCQLICQILNRVSSQTSSFQHVVSLDIPDLESIDHFPILTAVIGILLALLWEEIVTPAMGIKEPVKVPKITATLLSEPSFQMTSLHFLLGGEDGSAKKSSSKSTRPFTLLNYKDDVNEEEIERIVELIRHLNVNRALLRESRSTNDDDNDDTCTICYAHPIAVAFKPCNHRSCRGCIDRHVLNSRECFFCKAIITEIHDLEGTLLYNLSENPASLR